MDNTVEGIAVAGDLLARAAQPAADAMRLHALCRGKMQTLPKCPVRGFEDFAGTRVLGLGDIGPTAALPVMEGKAVWHDDQPGTATAVLAGLLNAAKLVGRDPRRMRIAMVGMGAANVACYRLLTANGVDARGIVACDSRGTLHRGRDDIERRQEDYRDKWRVCLASNADGVVGGVREALRGADACVAFSRSGPGIVEPGWVRAMARDAIVFACANPVPEIWPWEATDAGARIVATGRGDFPNQLNNSLVFPGLFRGALDVRARTITDEMASAVARALAEFAEQRGLRDDDILPRMDEWAVHPRLAVVAAMVAQAQGLARVARAAEELEREARRVMDAAREATAVLTRTGLIPDVR